MSFRSIASRLPLLLALLVASPLLLAKANDGGPQPLVWEKIHGKTAVEIVARLENQHFRRQPFDDVMSGQLLEGYLKALDPARLFLLQSDIDSFAPFRTNLDDSLHKGDIEPGFVIFRRYEERVVKRLDKVLKNLKKDIADMDFGRDEYLDMKRDTAPWPKSETEADELWRLRLKSAVLSLRLAGKKDEEIVTLLEKRHRNQLNRVKQYSGEDVFQIYMNALTSLYDPHTNYLSPRTSENFNINMSLKLEGIGAVLQMEDEFTRVARLVPAGPADKQGELRPADRIVGVAEGRDGELEDVIGWRLDDVVELIRGPKGSTVRLEVIPATAKSDAERRVISIIRNEVKLEEQSAQKRMIDIDHAGRTVKLGIIDIPAFYIDFEAMRRGDPEFKSTTRDVQKLLGELVADGAQGIIIDLRDNGGGSLQEANALTGLFIDSGPTVQIKHSSTRVFREGKPRSGPYYDGPMAVLINRLSASASEIFAGAIQDYQRGLIIGDQSFGKGTVQSLMPLQYGELKLTESKFYRISGESTQNRGILPDIVFPAVYDAGSVGESALEHALPWDRITPIRHRIYFDLQSALPQLMQEHQQRVRNDPDFVYLQKELELGEAARKQTRLSLNEAVRKRELADEQAQRLSLENARRKAKGLEPLAALEPEAESEADAVEETMLPPPVKATSDEPDPLLFAASHVLVDALPLYRKPSFAYRNY
jgi:carboxyl-terminal processing protease